MKIEKRCSDDKFKGIDTLSLGDFWVWAYSDILSNTIRPLIAEFLVGYALGVLNKPRREWDAIDLRYKGKDIEVKSAAYVQSWIQGKFSPIRFDIAEKEGWDAETNTYYTERKRMANVYVFCLNPERNREKIDILDIDQWEFYVISTADIYSKWGKQKSIGLRKVQAECEKVSFNELKRTVDNLIG